MSNSGKQLPKCLAWKKTISSEGFNAQILSEP